MYKRDKSKWPKRYLANDLVVARLELTDVLSVVLPNWTIEPETKFVPLTVSVKVPPPAMTVVGKIVVMVGDPLGVLDEEGGLPNDGFVVHPAKNPINANVAISHFWRVELLP